MIASAPLIACCTDTSMSSAVLTSNNDVPKGGSIETGADISVTSAPRSLAASAKAYPILPEDKFVKILTGSTGSCVPPAVMIIFLPLKSPLDWPITSFIFSKASSGSDNLPKPDAPDAREPSSGPNMDIPLYFKLVKLDCVDSFRYILVSIAGATMVGAVVDKIVVPRGLSHIPRASLAIEFAVAG
ncbi:MAG: Uncharacterised protein [Chloroflexota bacterium]|nr:MAG: Uncharacterised protein [Chloroflexota bacterium]